MIVERRRIELLGGGKLLYLLPPLRQQSCTFLPDKQGEFIKIIDDSYYVERRRFIKIREPQTRVASPLLREIGWCAVEVSNL